GVPYTARGRTSHAEDPGVGADREQDLAVRRGGGPWRARARRRARRARCRRGRDPREAALARALRGRVTVRIRWHPAYAFGAPAVGLLAVFFLLPTVAALVLSFTDFDVYAVAASSRLRLVGLDNYVRLLHDARFWTALRNTVWFVLVAGPASIAVSLAAALLVDAKVVRGRALFRTILFLPVVPRRVGVAVVCRYLSPPRYGLPNPRLGAVGIASVAWLGTPVWALPALALLAVWKNFGFNMLIFRAGLQAIPERLSEAARLDGANRWQELWHVTVPLLGPTFVFLGGITPIR